MPQNQNASTPEPQYDVAISFLSRDQLLASELADRLQEGLKVFFYPRAQEELAGTDGLESMRTPFESDSHLVVVLYREPWGKTPWTRVEETAIKDGCLTSGWSRLMFVTLDMSSGFPAWVPDSKVRFNFEEYGIDQLVGAIKARVQDQGGKIEKPDALSRARRVAREAAFLSEKASLFRNRTWIVENVHQAAQLAVQRAVELVNNGAETMQPPVSAALGPQIQCSMTDGRVSVAVAWKQEYFVDLSQGAFFIVRELTGALSIPEGRWVYAHEPKKIRDHNFVVELTAERTVAWKEVGKNELLSTEELANRVAMIFFDLISKANQGKVELPYL